MDGKFGAMGDGSIRKRKKNTFLDEKNAEKVWCVIKKPYLCIVKNETGGFVERLDYGVMVTQQILVLFFQVRVLVVQQNICFGLELNRGEEICCDSFFLQSLW